MANPELTLVVPALNESSIILDNIDELAAWMAQHQPSVSYEVLVVDDGSTDGMGELLEQASMERPWLKVAHHRVNKGRGRGVRTGFEQARGRYIICLDADLSYSPDHIPALLQPLQRGEADITLASAHHPDGKVINVPHQRAILSKWGNRILGLGFGGKFYTVTCIVRGFTREVSDALELVSDGKELHLEIIQKALLMGYRVIEVPAILKWRDRKRGKEPSRLAISEFALFKMRKTVVSHLIFNYISNPGILLLVPIVILLLIILVGGGMLLAVFLGNLGIAELSLLQALRQTLLSGHLTLLLVSFAFAFLMIFIGFYFLSFQSKRYFDEIYTLMMRMNARIKQLEKENTRSPRD
ncbi:MAG: glycosyltransferase family 2 protein [Gammaproteobacteria bacterium]|nr:glycosyltransferase family 2 protein [Gammaproteobacteria bacterium]